ncbi:uncharacterized protein LOC121430245 [Lytechinus variegatus]|uniref:uncharacterized protein LOC121430245 n=1 Tax=Lytechinus variegatus TaxID=7654 RepID=UPI001BB2C9D4|nr:uncharacterized protein LOC121430245 [Lytechinus variegatus]
MSLINETNNLAEEVTLPTVKQVDSGNDDQSNGRTEERLEESVTIESVDVTDSINVTDGQPDIVTEIDDRNTPPTSTTPSQSLSMASSPSPSATLGEQDVSTTTTTISTSESMTPMLEHVQGPVIRVYSPYIEDHREVTPGPNVFEKNIRNAIESRKHEEATHVDEHKRERIQTDDPVEESTGSNVLDKANDLEQGETQKTYQSFEGTDNPERVAVEPNGRTDAQEDDQNLVETPSNQEGAEISAETASSNDAKTNVTFVEPNSKENPNTSAEGVCNNEDAGTESTEQEHTTQRLSDIISAGEQQEKVAQTDNSGAGVQTQPDESDTLAQAKEWHDSIVRRVARLRGLSCWLGERNKRMDGMVEILVRSLEHMGVGAVTDHIGNLIPLQNFRLNSAIKLSTTDHTWTTCDEDVMSNDINSWLPDSLPDEHELPLTNEQMRKYESQLEVLRAKNESLQRSLQSALDSQGSLGVQINQWQACIDSAGQQLCRVTQEVHESKSREKHLRHLLGEERRIKDSLVQRNSLTKAEQDQTLESVNRWSQHSNEVMSGPTSSGTLVTDENCATPLQGMTAERQQVVDSFACNNYPGSSLSQITVKSPSGSERPWQQKRFVGTRDTRSSRLNSSAPPFVSAYSSSHRLNYRNNWHAGSNWHYRSGSGRTVGSSSTGRGRHGSGRGYYRKEHSSNAGFNQLLNGFFDNLNRIENALRQQGINVPGPTSEAVPGIQQQPQEVNVCSNVQYPVLGVHDLQQQQQEAVATNQPVYFSGPSIQQNVVFPDVEHVVTQQPIQSIPSVQQVHPSPAVVNEGVQTVPQAHVQFAQVEGQAY